MAPPPVERAQAPSSHSAVSVQKRRDSGRGRRFAELSSNVAAVFRLVQRELMSSSAEDTRETVYQRASDLSSALDKFYRSSDECILYLESKKKELQSSPEQIAQDNAQDFEANLILKDIAIDLLSVPE